MVMDPMFVFLLLLAVFSSCTSARVCKADTDWSPISNYLSTSSFILPTVPSPSGTVSPSVAPRDAWDFTLAPTVTGTPYNTTKCDAANAGWDSDHISFGPLESGYCRIVTDASTGSLVWNNRPIPNYIYRVSSQPAWVSARIPIPSGHRLVNFWMTLGWSRLFGSLPANCTGTDKQGNACVPFVNNTTWQPNVPSGFFLLWGNTADTTSCGSEGAGWIITGPYFNNTMTYSPNPYYFDVPDAIQNSNAAEIVVSIFVYNQYPGGCDPKSGLCANGVYTYQSLWVSAIQAHTWSQSAIMFPRQPPNNHPRIYSPSANSPAWTSDSDFMNLPCSSLPVLWGCIPNVRSIYSQVSAGFDNCTTTKPANLSSISFLSDYMKASPVCGNTNKGPLAFHFLRRMKQCYGFYGAGTGDPNKKCDWPLSQVTALQANVIACELAYLPSVVWADGEAIGYDLGSTPVIRYYSHFLDIFWYDLTTNQQNTVLAAMDPTIDAFITTQKQRNWALYNGNNWTPILSFGAIHWAILRFYEDPRAQVVAGIIFDTMWLHAPFYNDDGVYKESMSYAHYSLNAIYNLQYIVMKSFGRNINSHPWQYMTNFAKWYIANMMGDGRLTDLADSHRDQGIPVEVLYSLYYDKLLNMSAPNAPPASPAVDPCDLWRVFSNNYFLTFATDPWTAYPALIRDWASLTTCTSPPEYSTAVSTSLGVWPSGGWGVFRHFRSGATAQANLSKIAVNRYVQANTVTLTASAIPNYWPHVHTDFGTFIWTVYGARLLVDFGYGRIAGINDKYTMLERTPLAHNVLNIPEAIDTTGKGNTGQVVGTRGTIAQITTYSGYTCMLLDGTYVYGRNGTVDPNNLYGPSADTSRYGWLNDYKRWMCDVTPSGVQSDYLIFESFRVRADRPAISAENYFHTVPNTSAPATSACTIDYRGTRSVLVDSNTISVTAICSNLAPATAAESAGTLRGGALYPGGFFTNTTFVTDTIDSYQRYRWVPTNKVRSDVRGFILRSATSLAAVPSSNVVVASCSSQISGYPANGKICIKNDLGGSVVWAVFAASCGTSCTSDTFYDLEDVTSVTPTGAAPVTTTGNPTTTAKSASSTAAQPGGTTTADSASFTASTSTESVASGSTSTVGTSGSISTTNLADTGNHVNNAPCLISYLSYVVVISACLLL